MDSEFDIEKKIRELMELSKVSLKDVYTRLGKSKGGFLETMQKKTYTLSLLQGLAGIFNVTVSELIGEKQSGKNDKDLDAMKVHARRVPDLERIIGYQDIEIARLKAENQALKEKLKAYIKS